MNIDSIKTTAEAGNSLIFLGSAGLGFVAQMVGSSLGMAYSTLSTATLLSFGISPAMASVSVHTSEVVNRLTSGLSHFRRGNIDADMFKKLAGYGMAGAFCGAFVVTSAPVKIIKPIIALFLLLMGLRILLMGFGTIRAKQGSRRLPVGPLGFIGGVIDVIGGGGWGPVVTSTLVLRGDKPQIVVGTINLAKFFVAMVESATLLTLLKSPQWVVIGGLIFGGTVAAPLSAAVCRKINPKILMVLVGALVCGLSLRTLLKTL